MEIQPPSDPAAPDPETRRDGTCWLSLLLMLLMLLTVVVCGGLFVYALSHHHM